MLDEHCLLVALCGLFGVFCFKHNKDFKVAVTHGVEPRMNGPEQQKRSGAIDGYMQMSPLA